MTDRPARFTRRAALQIGGTVSLAALVAACGERAGSSAPGRIGNAPPLTVPPSLEIDDVLLVRTAMSVEFTALEVLRRTKALGTLHGTAADYLERFVATHTTNTETLADVATSAGGEPWTCANAWLLDRTWNPVFEQIEGTVGGEIAEPTATSAPDTGLTLPSESSVPTATTEPAASTAPGTTLAEGQIAPSDDGRRDALFVMGNLESVVAAGYQQMVTLVADGAIRSTFMTIAALEARQAAATAMLATGVPDGYVAPVVLGSTSEGVDEQGFTQMYAIASQFGSLAPITFNVGAAGAGGVRASFTLYTPADNSYITPDAACAATAVSSASTVESTG